MKKLCGDGEGYHTDEVHPQKEKEGERAQEAEQLQDEEYH